MHDWQTMKLMHRHTDGEWRPMVEGEHHNAAHHDPERSWLRGAKVFRCTACEDEVAMVSSEPPRTEPA